MDKCFTMTEISSKLIHVIWSVICSLVIVQIQGSPQIRHIGYNITEGVPNGYTIGDLLSDAKLYDEFHSDIVKSLFFKPLSTMPVNVSLAQDSGKLVVSGDLDREKMCLNNFYCEMTIDIAVQPQRYFRIIKVNIKVHDKNDNPPKFAERKFFTTLRETSERGTIVQLPYAEDMDSLKYGVKRYELVPMTNMFKLEIRDNVDGSQDVILILDKELDFETQRIHNLSLIAYDGGVPPKSGLIQIFVLVSDANDHIPYFVNTSYEITINENIPVGTSLLRVKAIDRDSGINSLVSYRFSDRTVDLYGKYFTVHNVTGDIVVRDTIDYEMHHIFHLAVVAWDMGPNSHPVDTTVIIRVLDQNDCSPEIEINTLNAGGSMGIAEVTEESPKGTFVAHITVKDRDSGPLGEVQCQLNNPNFMLQAISKDEYQIETNLSFDREIKDSYMVSLNCMDRGQNPNSATQRLKVQIIDINDHSPVFSHNTYEGSVTENFYEGQIVLRANATDLDIGRNAKIKYFIPDEKIRKLFHIDPENGIITTLQTFDREEKQRYTFIISAQDDGTPYKSTTSEVLVNVLDVNDEAPTFTKKSFSFEILENQPVGSIFGKVTAVDKDDLSNNRFTFRMAENSDKSFSVDPYTGELKTTKSLDREFKSRHRLVIQAEDEGRPPLSSPTIVTVDVLDTNDNNPKFVFPTISNNSVQIPASIPKNYAVSRVICKDLDAGKNGTVTYKTVSGEMGFFKVNQSSGVVITKQDLNAKDGDVFEISFLAHDNGIPSRYSATASLKIIVNKSLVLNADLVQKPSGLLSVANLKTVIIASVVLAFIIISLILILICIYCRRSKPPKKKEAKYDKFQIREATVDNFHDSDTTHMAALHTSTHEYAKDNDLMDDSGLQLEDYDYPRKLGREPMSYPVSFLMSKKANGHPNHHHHHYENYQKPVTCDYGTLQRPDQDQDSTYSGDGSNTDSGKGPSEEGDNNHLQNQGMPVSCNIPLAPVIEEDQRSNNEPTMSCTKYSTMGRPVRNHCSDTPSSVQYGFHRTLPHTVISGIPKCKCKSCNMNRFKTGYTTKQKDIIVPHTNGEHHHHDFGDKKSSLILEDTSTSSYRSTPNKTFKYDRPYVTNGSNFTPHQRQHCETEFSANGPIVITHSPRLTYNNNNGAHNYAPVDYHSNGNNLDPSQAHEEHDSSSTTSGSYVVDHHDMSDVLNDSHWNIRDAVSKDSVV